MSDANVYPNQRKVIQYVVFADDKDDDGHGTHVSGIAAGAITDGWETPWKSQVSKENCEDKGLVKSCLGSCVEEMAGTSCHWNQELSCPMSGCDEDTVRYFVCFGRVFRLKRRGVWGGGGGARWYNSTLMFFCFCFVVIHRTIAKAVGSAPTYTYIFCLNSRVFLRVMCVRVFMCVVPGCILPHVGVILLLCLAD